MLICIHANIHMYIICYIKALLRTTRLHYIILYDIICLYTIICYIMLYCSMLCYIIV